MNETAQLPSTLAMEGTQVALNILLRAEDQKKKQIQMTEKELRDSNDAKAAFSVLSLYVYICILCPDMPFLPSELFLVFRCLRIFGDHCDEIEALLPLLVLTKPSMLSVSCVLGAGEMRVRFEEVRTRDGTSEPRLKLSKTHVLAFSFGQVQTNFPTFVKIAGTCCDVFKLFWTK